jgi:predicted ArsR family transcriptional regulator
MTSLQQQARALGDPTRHGIFRYIADVAAPVGVAELTDHLGLNHNAIRQHLAKLVEAGLVVESTAAPAGRGRPRLEYQVDPRVDGRWGATGPYERLAVLLAEVVRTGDAAVDVGRRAAARLGPPARDGGAVQALVDEMARQGFDPLVRRSGASVELILQACPFTSAVLADPGTVCDLHLGLAQGVVEASGGLVVDELIPHDPRRAHCRLRCHEAPGTAEARG